MTELISAIERRVSLPDDHEAVRRQKLIAIFAGFSAILSTGLMTTTFFVTGLTALGWLHLAYGLTFAVLLVIALLQPRRRASMPSSSAPVSRRACAPKPSSTCPRPSRRNCFAWPKRRSTTPSNTPRPQRSKLSSAATPNTSHWRFAIMG